MHLLHTIATLHPHLASLSAAARPDPHMPRDRPGGSSSGITARRAARHTQPMRRNTPTTLGPRRVVRPLQMLLAEASPGPTRDESRSRCSDAQLPRIARPSRAPRRSTRALFVRGRRALSFPMQAGGRARPARERARECHVGAQRGSKF